MPSRENETALGLAQFEKSLQDAGLQLLRDKSHRYTDRLATYLVIGSGLKEVDLVLTDEFLSDFPHTPEQRQAVDGYIDSVRKRMRNVLPNAYYCRTGSPIAIDIEWPPQWVPNRAASFLWVRIRDLRTGLLSTCSAIMTHQFEIMDVNLKLNPFLREVILVENIRDAIDRAELPFYTKDQLPTELPSIRVQKNTSRSGTSSSKDVQQFLLGKVYWLGFKQGDKNTSVWVTDPWDAEYLGSDAKTLLQAAQTLEAADYLVLSDQGFATAGKALLLNGEQFEIQSPKPFVRESGSVSD